MAEIFISYARSAAVQAARIADALRAAGHRVWMDNELPAHRAYGDVIEERLAAAKAVLVLWSADAARSQWVRSEANAAREQHKLVQLSLDGTKLPMPFDQIQCADLIGWMGDTRSPGWQKVLASIAEWLGTVAAQVAPAFAGMAAASHRARVGTLAAKPSLAVLPFSNLSSDPGQDYLADGIVLEIIEALSRSRAIFVIANSSSMAFKGSGISARDAAAQLQVRFVLEGSVRKSGERIRIGVQLVDASEGTTIWTERFDDRLEDIFDLQDRVAIAVAGKIEPSVEQAEIRRAGAHPSTGSQDFYLRALPEFRAHTKDATFAALDLLTHALAQDATHGPALALAVSCHRTIVLFGWANDIEMHRASGIEIARRALTCAADDARVLASIASDLSVLDKRLDVALPLARRASELSPGSANVLFNCGCVRLMAGEHEVARKHFEQALRLDPAGGNRPVYLLWLAAAHFFERRFDTAVALLLERNHYAESPASAIHLAAAYAHLGRLDEARAAISRYRALSPVPVATLAQMWLHLEDRELLLRGVALARAGEADD